MGDPLQTAARRLVREFARRRPLRGGSLIVTIFGDALAPRGGAVSLGSLIRLAQPFGLTERLVRTAVARLAQDGWLASRRDGRRSDYHLTPSGRSRFAEATRRIYGEGPRDWDGSWTLVLLPPDSARRDQVREEMRWLGFGQLGPGVLAHPGHSQAETRRQLAELGLTGEAVILRAATDGRASDLRLAGIGWDLAELARRYRAFVASFTPALEALSSRRRPSPETAFIVRTLLIHEYRRIHLRDPLLPAELLPADWIGLRASALCRELYAKVFAAAEAHLSSTAETTAGPLPAVSRQALERFGGALLGEDVASVTGPR